MDAVKFIKEAKRMCQSYVECKACPANADGFNDCLIDNTLAIDAHTAVNIVEEWAKKYPIETNQDRFLKIFPEVEKSQGIVDVCPRTVSNKYRKQDCVTQIDCTLCRKEFWLSEAE